MFKYLYYVWNLLSNDEKKELFAYFGTLVVSAFLLTVVDWQYYILFGFILQGGVEKVFRTVVATQLIVWLVNLWYYYLKYRILLQHNKFYRIVSNRHYEYTLQRISQNAPLQWISQKSVPELAKQLDASDKSLQVIFNFISRTLRSGSMVLINLLILGMTYSYSIFFLVPTLLFAYTLVRNDHLISSLEDIRGDFTATQQENYLMISDNLSTLFDEVVSGNYTTLINNILKLNSGIKGKQNLVSSSEDRMYTKLSLSVISGYLVMIIFSFLSTTYQFEHLCMYIMTMFLSYRSLNNNLNTICDAYYDLRLAELEFDALGDIWTSTQETRPVVEPLQLDGYEIEANRLRSYHQMIYNRIDRNLLDIYRSYIVDHALAVQFRSFKTQNYGDDVENQFKIEMYHNFMASLPNHYNVFNTYYQEQVAELEVPDLDEIHQEFWEDCLNQQSAKYSLSLQFLSYRYTQAQQHRPFRLSFTEEVPIQLLSNSHLLVKGPSGSGKSTLLKVIRGIIQVPQCETHSLSQNGIHLSCLDTSGDPEQEITWMEVSNCIGYCQQNTVSFVNGTVYQIMSGDFTGTEKDVDEVARMKLALETACVGYQLSQLDTPLKSSEISGGQKQRLTVAKHIYRVLKNDSRIVILDEIDAGLDFDTARQVIFNLRVLFADRMLIVVLHSSKLQDYFEEVITVNDGVIQKGDL